MSRLGALLRARNRAAIAAGVLTLLMVDAALLLIPEGWPEIIRENAVDIVLGIDQRLPRAPSHESAPPVIVVDIDRHSLDQIGPWPWPREKMAELTDAIRAQKPSVVVFDILFSGADERSPAGLARRLARLTGRPEFANIASELPDGDKRLAGAFDGLKVALGFVLDPEQAGSVPTAPILVRGPLPLSSLWRGAGALGPPSSLASTVQGLGALSLPADADGAIRRVPIFLAAGDNLLPGLALEAARLQRRASGYTLQSDPPEVALKDIHLPLPPDGLLRLLPVGQDQRAARTIPALALLQQTADGVRLAGAVVIVGGSAPELGGLRETPTDPLTPDAQIQADAVTQIFDGRVPRPIGSGAIVALLLINATGLVMLIAAAELAPATGAAILGLTLLLLWGAAVALSTSADRLIDPLTPSLGALAVFAVVTACSYAITQRREILVRRSFEQHLAPAVVRRIVEEPGLVKLGGERREVTALFTDIEGFTAMTHRAAPEQLVALLDEYFEGGAAIVMAHGGMIDKIVGDAIHALFNAPFDLADHPVRAMECAVALRRWSAAFRQGKLPASLGLGRTRIGIETGPAVVGDVGIRAKLDYTAHGDAINAAARLEAANKELGSTICIGPVAASRCDPVLLRPLGTIALRGRDELYQVFEPWPEGTPAEWRARYLDAFRTIDQEPSRAATVFAELATERDDDPVPRVIAERLRRQ